MGRTFLRTQLNPSASAESPSRGQGHRRMLSRNSSSSTSSSPTRSSPPSLYRIFNNSRPSSPHVSVPARRPDERESDIECWERMLALQMEFHCYKSARLEAAVEALECGRSMRDVPIPSRLCLDLLNEELRAQIESEQVES